MDTISKRTMAAASKRVNAYPFGNSYIDRLPEDLTHVIFKMKHASEFAPSLEMIKMFGLVFDHQSFRIRIPLKDLFKQITKRKIFHIDVEEYLGDLEYSNNPDSIKSTEKLMNVKVVLNKPNDPLHYMPYRDKYTDARIKWLNTRPVLVIDIIIVSSLANMKSIKREYVVDSLSVDGINNKKDDLTVKLV